MLFHLSERDVGGGCDGCDVVRDLKLIIFQSHFNRIDVEVLSVIAQQLLQIRTALLLGKTEFVFVDGNEMVLKTEFGCHVTMDPG